MDILTMLKIVKTSINLLIQTLIKLIRAAFESTHRILKPKFLTPDLKSKAKP